MRWFFSPGLLVVLATGRAEAQGDAGQAARLGPMRAIAEMVAVETVSPAARVKVERLPDPIYLFDDPARHFTDGAVWAWGKSGRPAALLTLSIGKRTKPVVQQFWLGEMTSLAPTPLSGTIVDGPTWEPAGPGFDLRPIPKSPAPAGDEAKRLRQMKELARRFRGFENYKPLDAIAIERYELRLLPQPVLRYSDPDSGLIDGAMFLIVYGRNPEVALVIEARRERTTEPSWGYGLGRIAAAELHVLLDENEVWRREKSRPAPLIVNEPYWTFVKPLEAPE